MNSAKQELHFPEFLSLMVLTELAWPQEKLRLRLEGKNEAAAIFKPGKLTLGHAFLQLLRSVVNLLADLTGMSSS